MSKPKIGARVRFTRRNGTKAEGRITGTRKEANGLWIEINTAAPRQPQDITSVRPVNVEYI